MLGEYRKAIGAFAATLAGYIAFTLWELRMKEVPWEDMPVMDTALDGALWAAMAALGAFLPATIVNGKNAITTAKSAD